MYFIIKSFPNFRLLYVTMENFIFCCSICTLNVIWRFRYSLLRSKFLSIPHKFEYLVFIVAFYVFINNILAICVACWYRWRYCWIFFLWHSNLKTDTFSTWHKIPLIIRLFFAVYHIVGFKCKRHVSSHLNDIPSIPNTTIPSNKQRNQICGLFFRFTMPIIR